MGIHERNKGEACLRNTGDTTKLMYTHLHIFPIWAKIMLLGADFASC